MYRNIVRNIIDHETNYVEWLNVFLKVWLFSALKFALFECCLFVSIWREFNQLLVRRNQY